MKLFFYSILADLIIASALVLFPSLFVRDWLSAHDMLISIIASVFMCIGSNVVFGMASWMKSSFSKIAMPVYSAVGALFFLLCVYRTFYNLKDIRLVAVSLGIIIYLGFRILLKDMRKKA